MFSRLRFTLMVCLMAITPVLATNFATAQTGATVRGNVVDPDNALIPGATVTLTPTTGKAQVVVSGSDGTYVFRNVSAGTYSLTSTATGFGTFVKLAVRVNAGQALTQDIKMTIQEQEQVVQVTTEAARVSVDADSNASSTVIKGKDLEALSDDPDELSSELTALAGPAAGPNGGQIYVDGFTGGQLPPKSSIREIRINQNPFSAQYDKIGFGRVEVFTKPGTDKFHGSASLQGNDSSFNSTNPFEGAPIPYHTIFFLGQLTGPLSKNASFTVGGSHRTIQSNSLINPTGFYSTSTTSTTLCPPGALTQNGLPCFNTGGYPSSSRSVFVPQTRYDITPRIDYAISQKNTLTVRYQYESNSTMNDGLGGITTLPSQGYNDGSSESTVQISDSQIVSDKIVNETRFEYQHTAGYQTPASTAATDYGAGRVYRRRRQRWDDEQHRGPYRGAELYFDRAGEELHPVWRAGALQQRKPYLQCEFEWDVHLCLAAGPVRVGECIRGEALELRGDDHALRCREYDGGQLHFFVPVRIAEPISSRADQYANDQCEYHGCGAVCGRRLEAASESFDQLWLTL